MNNKKIHIIGAGFSGLTIAYYLYKIGFTNITIFEKENYAGGLIATHKTSNGFVESAANTIINNTLLESLLNEVSLSPQYPQEHSKKRYIYKSKSFKRWPIGIKDTFVLLYGLLKIQLNKTKNKPIKNQTIEDWATLVFNKNISQYLISPALQGIYASSAKDLSATLIIGKYFSTDNKRIKSKGIISFQEGMGQLPKTLETYLKSKGVSFIYNHLYKANNIVKDKDIITIIATSLKQAIVLDKRIDSRFNNVPLKNISTVTLFFDKNKHIVPGFGVLYPRNQNITSLGSLMNDKIFKGRSINSTSETWIIENNDKDDNSILGTVLCDRNILTNNSCAPKESHIKTWKGAFPLYGKELEKSLNKEDYLEESHIYLTGNYLGQLGLSGILSFNNELAKKIRNKYEKESITTC